jgi:ATP-binding cassette subfamily B protein
MVAGHDVRDIALHDLRRHVAFVPQGVELFKGSIRDNLTFFDDTIGEDEVLRTISVLGMDDWFGALQEGLDTDLKTRGGGVSAGEAQLLALMRAFLKEPGIVVLDEASSRLDPHTEAHLERAIDMLLRDRTGIVIAHRLATVQRVDKILIVEDGRVVEFGSRVELMANPSSVFNRLLSTGLEEVMA